MVRSLQSLPGCPDQGGAAERNNGTETGVMRAGLSFCREQLEEKIQTGITFLIYFWPSLFCMSFNMQVLIKSV